MRTTTTWVAERPPRSQLRDQAGRYRRGELAAGLATAAIVGQLLFAQAVLLAAVGLVAIGRVSRWRPHWLAVPALASVTWLLAVGLARALAGLDQGSRRLAGYLLGAAVHPGRLAHPAAAMAGAAAWLPKQLPLALLAACGEAWIVLWLGWWRRGMRWRPGLVVLLRRRMSAAALAAGHTATWDGCAVGLAVGTGKLAGFSWAEATYGVLMTGHDADRLGLAAACAALRRRKTVLILDCSPASGTSAASGLSGAPVASGASGASVTERVRALARSLGVPVTDAGEAGLAGAIGRAIRSRETVLIATAHAEAARRAVADLADVVSGLRDLGLRADCLTWITGCESIDPASLSELLAIGPLTGTAIILSTPSPARAASLAPSAGVVVVSGPVSAELALDLVTAVRDVSSGLAAHARDVSSSLSAQVRYAGSGLAASGRESESAAQLGAADPPPRPMAATAMSVAGDSSRAIASILTAQPACGFTMLAGARPDGGPPRVTNVCRSVAMTPDHLR